MIKEMWVLASASHMMQIPTIIPQSLPAKWKYCHPALCICEKLLSVVCLLKTQESHELLSHLKNSLLLLVTTLGSRTKSKLHSSLWALQFVVWGKWCVCYFSHWHRYVLFKCPRKLALASQTFLRSKTVLYLPQLLFSLSLFPIITWV